MTLLQQCKEQGILTEEKIRKFSLTLSNLHVVLKMYAVETWQPYEYKLKKGVTTPYYLTDKGLEFFYNFFRTHTFTYCRSLFSQLLIYAEDGFDPVSYPYFSNFRGTDGITSGGTKQRALIIRTVGRCQRKYFFDTIKEARENLRIWLTQYPIEQFKIYRVRTKDGYDFKEEITLIPERHIQIDPFKKVTK
jgi:hypothetical protein